MTGRHNLVPDGGLQRSRKRGRKQGVKGSKEGRKERKKGREGGEQLELIVSTAGLKTSFLNVYIQKA